MQSLPAATTVKARPCRSAWLLWLLLAAAICIAGCRQVPSGSQVARSFYYWKSALVLKQPELDALRLLRINRLYIRFFDVGWNAASRQPMPLAVTSFPHHNVLPDTSAIIPTIFITKECIANMDSTQVMQTAQLMMRLTDTMIAVNRLANIPEVQIDCDWTAATRQRYFALLAAIRQLTARSNRKLSATIRLYQCKYAGKAGVPPVDRGLLMCYNMGNLRNPEVKNSILDLAELKQYTSALPLYPLPLDIALPLFGWKVLFRNNRYAGLISTLPAALLTGNPLIRQSGNRYTFSGDVFIDRYVFKAGDVLRDEQISIEALTGAARLLGRKLKTAHFTVALYHLDSLTLSKFPVHDLEAVYNYFN